MVAAEGDSKEGGATLKMARMLLMFATGLLAAATIIKFLMVGWKPLFVINLLMIGFNLAFWHHTKDCR